MIGTQAERRNVLLLYVSSIHASSGSQFLRSEYKQDMHHNHKVGQSQAVIDVFWL